MRVRTGPPPPHIFIPLGGFCGVDWLANSVADIWSQAFACAGGIFNRGARQKKKVSMIVDITLAIKENHLLRTQSGSIVALLGRDRTGQRGH